MRLVPLAIQMLLLALPLFADDPLSRYIDADALQKLRAGSSLSASMSATGTLSLIPHFASSGAISASVQSLRPSIGVEYLRVIGGFQEPTDTPSMWLRIYNALHAVSTMRGIKYYSVTRGSEQVLFTESYAISSSQDRTRIDDPVFSAIPSADVLFTLQEDRSFGRNAYQESFDFRGDHLVVKIENLSAISFLLVPLIQPRKLVSTVAIVAAGKEILFYGVAYASTSMPLGDRHSREDSFFNRLVAMSDWLRSRLPTVEPQ